MYMYHLFECRVNISSRSLIFSVLENNAISKNEGLHYVCNKLISSTFQAINKKLYIKISVYSVSISVSLYLIFNEYPHS